MRHPEFTIMGLIAELDGYKSSVQDVLDYEFPGMKPEDLTEEESKFLISTTFKCDSCEYWMSKKDLAMDDDTGNYCQDCWDEQERFNKCEGKGL